MTEYRRYQGKSYMVCSEEQDVNQYELHMLLENQIPGILPIQVMHAEEGSQYWYDISSRWDLANWADTHKLGSIFLKRFFSALQYTLEHIGDYLLDEAGISLKPEHVFVDMEEKEICFCYMPFEKVAFEEGIRSFMEYYLQHMEHSGQNEIQKCYEVYDRCQGQHVSLEELMAVLYENVVEQEEEQTEICEVPEEKGETEESESKSFSLPKWNWKPNVIPIRKKKPKEVPYAFEPEEEAVESSNPTVFLGSEIQQIIGELRYEGNGCESNLKIEGPIFLIGSQKEEAAGVIHASTVSRLHAKISKEGEDYYIEDMNSTNGTYRNGELLTYRQKELLQKNDVIKFADEPYRFV